MIKILGPITAASLLVAFLLWNNNSTLRQEIKLLDERVGRLTVAHQNCMDANQTTRLSLERALSEHRACTTMLADSAEAERQARERLNHASEIFRETAERERRAREEIFANENCQLAGRVNLDQLCPAMGERLRLNARP